MTALTSPRTLAIRGDALRQLVTFGTIGAVSTLAYLVLYAWLRQAGVSAGIANTAALLVTAVANTAANRRLTFAVKGRDGLARDHAAGIAALGVTLAITTASLGLLELVAPHHGRGSELIVLVGANGVATVARFLLLRLALRAGRQAVPASSNLR